MKRLAILGSTGSIGRQTLDLVEKYPEAFDVRLLTCNRSAHCMKEQILKHQPALAVACHPEAHSFLSRQNLGRTKLIGGARGILEAMGAIPVDLVVNALVGISGLSPTRKAIELGVDVALANKETLVTAGEAVMRDAAEKGVRILPVDSEHNAIYQCLNGESRNRLKRIILTASGGPFRGLGRKALESVTLADALKHPNWEMGSKITIDSATMMNKGFEVLEAKWLFDLEMEAIEVLVHPQSIIHSMVAFEDESVLAQLSNPDMRLPIGYVLFDGDRRPNGLAPLDLGAIGSLTFEKPDCDAFPCLGYAYEAGRRGGTCPAALNAANEVLVEAFLEERIRFLQIPDLLGEVMARHQNRPCPDYDSILGTDLETRIFVERLLKGK